jgi:uncharacterized protein YuzE
VNFVYSTDADALYIELEAVRRVARTVEVSPSCLVDLDTTGQPLGIELLTPSISFVSIPEVLTRWEFSRERTARLLTYPYQSLTPRRRSASSAARSRVEIESRQPELLTSA